MLPPPKMPNTISVLLARYPGDCVTVPFLPEEPTQALLDRVSERLCTTFETGRLYIDGMEVWDYQRTVRHYRQFGSLFVYTNSHPYSSSYNNNTLSRDGNSVNPREDSNNLPLLEIFVYSTNGKHFIVRMLPTSTILELKATIRARQGIPVKSQSLVYDCKYLADTRTINDYGIRSHATIDLSVRLCGGQASTTGGLSLFADVADQSAICSGKFNQSAPLGRRAGIGTNIDAICKCSPEHRVVSNQGCGIYELGVTQSKCPLCNSIDVTPVTVIFWACEYRTRGIKPNGEKHVSEWRRVTDGPQYEHFNPKKRATWASLLIETRFLDDPDFCPICLELTTKTTAAVGVAIKELISYGHVFHRTCIDRLGNK